MCQILRFACAVELVYPAGVQFQLVIDDLCAWMANDIPLDATSAYLKRLQSLIRSVGLVDLVGVLAESTVLSIEKYQQTFTNLAPRPWTSGLDGVERENVSRFVGRLCYDDAVRDHLERYQRAQQASAQLMALHLDGVRLTQRASEHCLGFRSFPGGDARIQSGEVDLVISEGKRPRPRLITSRTLGRHLRWPLTAPHLPPDWPLAPGIVHLAIETTTGS